MNDAEHADNRIVIHFPVWVRALGGLCFLLGAGMSWGLGQDITEDIVSLILLICVGLPMLFGGIWMMGYTFRLVFDHTVGNMTIRTGVGPLTYRIKHISKEQVLSVRAFELPRERYYGTWAVSLRIKRRKKEMKIIESVAESRATYVANGIKVFLGSQSQRIPRLSAKKVSRGIELRKISKYTQLPDGEIEDHGFTSLNRALTSLEDLPETELPLPENQVPLTLGFEDEEGAFIEFFKEEGKSLWTVRVERYKSEDLLTEVSPEQAVSIIEDFFLGVKLSFSGDK